MTRRTALELLTTAPPSLGFVYAQTIPTIASGAPRSAERLALIAAFRQSAAGLAGRFEPRTHQPVNGWAMPYRLFQPPARTGAGKLPLVLYLHGAGGIGADNRKQIGGGNTFGTSVWALEENQKKFPCYIAAPQTDRGWIRYDRARTPGGERPNAVPGFGEGARIAVEIVESLCREFPIDERRIYVTGNSMGGGGTWHMVAHKPSLFAAAVPVCGGRTAETGAESPELPVWNFHGDADKTVPVEVSRERIAARRKAGGKPVYTEYPGVGHNVSEWAYTEPALVEWVFAQRK